MKKFNRTVHKSMGSLPPQLFKYVDMSDIGAATAEFNDFITKIAHDFHSQLDGTDVDSKELKASNLFGQPVSIDYVARGSVGSVYKIKIGTEVFALKINRRSSFGELNVMQHQNRAKNLLNKAYFGSVFEYNGRKYSWIVSDFIEKDTEHSFIKAMEKLYFSYLTKGIAISDAHPGNIKNGKVIDTPSFGMRNGKVDDIKQLNLRQIDIVKKLVNYIKVDNMDAFKQLIDKVKKSDFIVINYLFFAMKYGRSPVLSASDKDFFEKIKRYEQVVDNVKKEVLLQSTHNTESGVSL